MHFVIPYHGFLNPRGTPRLVFFCGKDTNARSDGTLYFVSIKTPAGTSNGFTDFPIMVGNTTATWPKKKGEGSTKSA